MAFKHKAVSTHIKFMFTRSMFQTEDYKNNIILNEVAKLIDLGMIKPTLAENFGTINENLRKARLLETGKAIGKIVLFNEW
jgi:NADPH:quinone reductase-like Zn-dependent oxidoreductase